MKKLGLWALSFALLIGMSGCSGGAANMKSKNLSEEASLKKRTEQELQKELSAISLSGKESAAVSEFSLQILREAHAKKDGESSLISGISILSALGMSQNGAAGETLQQMEETLGIRRDALNKFVYQFQRNLGAKEDQKLFPANSIWIKDSSLSVKEGFLQKNKDFYQSQVFESAFDESTVKDINAWVSDNTNGMIDKILDEISPDAVMYLINALYFMDDWEEPYEKDRLYDDDFMREDYTLDNVTFMYSDEYIYLSDEMTTGVMKPYKNQRYYFVALLPKSGTKMQDYLEQLSGEKMQALIQNKTYEKVHTSIPKFKSKDLLILNETLQKMGMSDAFDPNRADFSELGNAGNKSIFISKILHKTYIEVDEKGTKAAAVTAVQKDGCTAIPEKKEVILNRPFVYLIYDSESDVPVFMGTLMRVE
ncbi:MAG: serpin family protein [Bacillota bacterium]|nr:serpin family protein [Bacillota bacterium]